MNKIDRLRYQKRVHLSHLSILMAIQKNGMINCFVGFDFEDEVKQTESMITDLNELIKRTEHETE